MVAIKRLGKKYNGVSVLKNVNLTVSQGSIFGIIGQSGTGKSTLLRCINGLETFGEGEIIVGGVSVGDLNELELRQFRRNIGMIFQDFALLERKTVFENVCLPMECWQYPLNERKDKAVSLLKHIGLEDKLYSMPSELSGGQKQRVAIARALTLDPKVLLCDEATSALDPQITESILDLLLDINKELGITVVIVTHEMEVIKRICDRVAIMVDGNIALEGTVSDVFMQDNEALSSLINRPQFEVKKGMAILCLSLTNSEKQANILYDIANVCNVSYKLIYADISAFKDKYMGRVYIEIDGHDLAKTGSYLREKCFAYREESAGVC
jgi:D-methionine transport system ATP-binding protein